MKSSGFKPKPCECGGMHSSLNCPQKARATLRRASKPMRRESAKHRKERQETNRKWFKANPPPIDDTYWICYLRIAPDCYIQIDKNTLDIEHVKSKARHPELRGDINNLKPSCPACNELKGSRGIEDLVADYPNLKVYL